MQSTIKACFTNQEVSAKSSPYLVPVTPIKAFFHQVYRECTVHQKVERKKITLIKQLCRLLTCCVEEYIITGYQAEMHPGDIKIREYDIGGEISSDILKYSSHGTKCMIANSTLYI